MFFDQIRFPCAKDGTQIYKMMVNGKFEESELKKTIDIFSPIENHVLARVQAATKKDVDRAFRSAKNAQVLWKEKTLYERADILKKIADELEKNVDFLSQLLIKEIGKQKEDSRDEVLRTAELIRATADEAKSMKGELVYSDVLKGYDKRKIGLVHRIPLGVVLAISPFNYPINLAASKLAPALVTGNTVVFKPSTQGAISGLCMALIFNKFLPKGVLNVITGKASEIGDYVVCHPDVSMIAFTGSTTVGKSIASKVGLKPLLMELGGKDAALVLADADLGVAVKQIASGAFSYGGQRCTSMKRVFVEEKVAQKFIDQLVKEVKTFKVGDPHEEVRYGPLINNEAEAYLFELLEDAKAKGAKVKCGASSKNRYFQPTVVDFVTEHMRLAWEEQFGPVLPIIRVKDVGEAIKLTNKSQYGLSAAIFTKDVGKALEIANKLDTGTVQINGRSARGPDHFPFVSTKDSGIGVQGIKYSIEAMTRMKLTVLNLEI